MRIQKDPIRPDKIRQIPKSFSWIDRRVIRENYITKIDVNALALYLLLSLVGDQYGLSYYSDKSLTRLLGLGQSSLRQARHDLINIDLIAYDPPLYQVLDLSKKTPSQILSRQKMRPLHEQRSGETDSIGSVLNRIMKGNDND